MMALGIWMKIRESKPSGSRPQAEGEWNCELKLKIEKTGTSHQALGVRLLRQIQALFTTSSFVF